MVHNSKQGRHAIPSKYHLDCSSFLFFHTEMYFSLYSLSATMKLYSILALLSYVLLPSFMLVLSFSVHTEFQDRVCVG